MEKRAIGGLDGGAQVSEEVHKILIRSSGQVLVPLFYLSAISYKPSSYQPRIFPSFPGVFNSSRRISSMHDPACTYQYIPVAMLPSLCYSLQRTNNKTSASYRKYSPLPPRPAGTARLWSGTAEKIWNSGLRSSPRFMMDATLPQR